jgi:PTH1 family peptidyl-tRNA hydrolase
MKYMNLSGEALMPIMQFYKVPLGNLIVVHDELDLAPGYMRVKKGGGSAGNQGIKNICKHLGADFLRLRVGIGHPKDKIDEIDGKPVLRGGKNQSVSSWVLAEAGPNDQELLDKAIPFAEGALRALVSKGLTSAQKDFNGRVK